jgi:polysaccharide deacetylase family protein (PEP-CTERM system associated)
MRTTGSLHGEIWILSDKGAKSRLILSFDVEDNFTREELADPGDWDKFESQVVENTKRVVKLLNDINGDATFFVVGKTAERRPEIVRIISESGFEVASHGYAHEPVDQMTEQEFEEDLANSIAVLEGISGKKVKGYRAMAFSINRNTPWAFEVMKRRGLEYDSSLTKTEFDSVSGGGAAFDTILNGFSEVPVCNKTFFGKKLGVSGGIVLRLTPYTAYRLFLENACGEDMCRIVYAHVWEFNKDQPARRVGLLQKISQSSLTYTTPSKIKKLSSDYEIISLRSFLQLKNYKDRTESQA